MGGLSIGIFWGIVVSAVGLAALSLSSPLPPRGGAQEVAAVVPVGDVAVPEAMPEAEEVMPVSETDPVPAADAPALEGAPVQEPAQEDTPAQEAEPEEAAAPATEIPLPSGSEFNRPPPEAQAALPTPDAAPSVTAPQAPVLAGDVSAPSFDTAPAAQPDVSAQAPAAIAALATEGQAPVSPAASAAPAISDGPTALNVPETSATPQVRTALLPQIETPEAAIETTPDVTETAPDPEPVPLTTPVFPTVGALESPNVETPDVPDDIASEAGVEAPEDVVAEAQGSGLPQVAPVDAEVDGETPETDGPLRAIEAFATPFDASDARPLMAVVLIDEPDSRIEISTLTRFSFPVAFAIDPLHPDAAERAAAYREAGFEVVILGSMIPEGAAASDLEVALSAALELLPEAVAVIDTPEGRIQGDRPVLDATVSALAESGHGLLAFPRGLNAAEQSATRAGVPGATLFRLLDDEDQRATVITRFLGRAAFTATQEGTVIVAGRTRPDTVTALFSWALGGRSEGVALAPLSATLLRSAAP